MSVQIDRRAFLETGAASAIGLTQALATSGQNAPAMGLRLGFGAGDITPSVGMQLPGGFAKMIGRGVADKLWAVAFVVHDGVTPVALVGTDTGDMPKDVALKARRLIQKETGIPGEHVLIGANHTHTGGPVTAYADFQEDAVYLDRLVNGIVAAVRDAYRGLRPAEIGIGTGREASITFNRRFLMRNGREITHPGKPGTPHHAEIVRPAGPIDPDVGVLAARDAEGKVFGVVVNFACHSTVYGGDQFHPDYAGFLRKHLKAHYGDQTQVVFLLGACGDITQVDNMSTAVEFGPKHCEMMGMKLAAEAIRTIDRMAWGKEAATAVTVETVVLPIREVPDYDSERPPFGLGSDELFGAKKYYEHDRQRVIEMRKRTPNIPCEVQAIRIGPLGIATNGAEYFCEYALRMKQCSPFEMTWFVSLANESIGYVPTAQAFMGGGYETRTCISSRLAVDAGQRLLETGLKGLAKVRR